MNTSITVQNLRCGGCANTITTKLSEIENITEINVDIENSIVSFSYQSEKDFQAIYDRLKSLGYPSVDDDNGMMTKAKSIVSCATGKLK